MTTMQTRTMLPGKKSRKPFCKKIPKAVSEAEALSPEANYTRVCRVIEAVA